MTVSILSSTARANRPKPADCGVGLGLALDAVSLDKLAGTDGLNVRSEAYAKALVALAVEKFGRLDIAFNNAGTLGEAGPSTQVSEAGWNDAIAINLTGSFLGAKHQIAEMLKHGGGSVIFTSTFVGYSFAFPGVAAYGASKSGLIGLTQALTAEFGARGVRVNAILPGAAETGMYRDMNDTAEKQAFMTNLHALRRVAQREERARSVLYLASDDSSTPSAGTGRR